MSLLLKALCAVSTLAAIVPKVEPTVSARLTRRSSVLLGACDAAVFTGKLLAKRILLLRFEIWNAALRCRLRRMIAVRRARDEQCLLAAISTNVALNRSTSLNHADQHDDYGEHK